MEEKYDQQDGSPEPRPDSNEVVSDPNNARPAMIGERSTKDKTAGQGLGQMTGSGQAKELKNSPPQLTSSLAAVAAAVAPLTILACLRRSMLSLC